MAETTEKRGPIEKTESGWPINPFGVLALVVFALIVIFLIVRPFYRQQTVPTEQGNAAGGTIVSPQSGEIIRSDRLALELKVDDPEQIEKVQFWVKTYADGEWVMAGEVNETPFRYSWAIPASHQNKAIAITSHIFYKSGNITKDPGGWREGIIIIRD